MSRRVLITGASESGKSFFAQSTCKKNSNALVYTSTLDAWTDASEVYRDPEVFMQRVTELVEYYESLSRKVPAVLYIDEADEILGHTMRENFWLLKRGRHYFDAIYVITQRPTMIAPTVRGQCNELYAFRLHKNDAEALARDFATNLDGCPTLKLGEFYHVHNVNRTQIVDLCDNFT